MESAEVVLDFIKEITILFSYFNPITKSIKTKKDFGGMSKSINAVT